MRITETHAIILFIALGIPCSAVARGPFPVQTQSANGVTVKITNVAWRDYLDVATGCSSYVN
jgi:hypothetical protein